MGNIVIYVLKDPRTMAVSYVGQTRKGEGRFQEHLRLVENPAHHGMRKLYNWIRSLKKNGLIPIFEVVQELSTIEELDDAEVFWGEFFRRMGCPLKNVAPFGSNGKWTLTEKGFKSRSDGRRGPLHHFYGKKHRPETILRMRAVKRSWTPEQVEKSAAKRRRPFRCIETGEVFGSIADFVNSGRGSSAIKHHLNGHQPTFKGLHYERIA